MNRYDVYKGQRVRHVRRGFTGTVVHVVDSNRTRCFGIKVDEQYVSRLADNTNYHNGFYWAAAFNLEPTIEPQQIYHLVSTIFCQEVSQ